MKWFSDLIWRLRYWQLDRKRRKMKEIRWTNYFARGGQW